MYGKLAIARHHYLFAMGMALARDLKKTKEYVIPIIGDGALTGGMALEALNHIGHENRHDCYFE